MIQRLNCASLNFKANEASSPRDTYKERLDENSQTAQKQNNLALQLSQSIPMQGKTGEKLDVVV